MKPACAVVLLALAACGPRAGGPRSGEPAASVPAGMPMIPDSPAVVIPEDANVVVVVSEAVGAPERDYASYTKVYVDNSPAGQTRIEAKSKPKKWGAKLAPGNHLFRFETWLLPPSGDWQMLDPQWQPAERFVRVVEGQRSIVSLKFIDGGIKHDLQIVREALPE